MKTREELIAAAQRYYDEHLKAELEPEHTGELIAVDPERRLYALSQDASEAFARLRALGSAGPQVLLRVGCASTFQMLQAR
jgi:hypothetical protein